ncbi:MAG TPA: hypothetical protein VGH73_24440 [Thermoanaerobaculia bacterium]
MRVGEGQILLFLNRTFGAFLLTVALLAGAVDLHPAGESHSALSACRKGHYSRSATHPSSPAHFEAWEEGVWEACPVCLHKLRTGGAHLPLSTLLASPAAARFRELVPVPLALKRFAAPRGARGPPSA